MADLTVDYGFLGKTGIKVSNLCLGTMTFGQAKVGLPGQCDEALSHEILNRYIEWGGNFIDTADVYSQGLSESIIGNWLTSQKEREKIILGTKVFAPLAGSDMNSRGLSRRHITASIERSLERLQTNYVDLYQIHCWDNGTPIRETLLTLNDLVRCGKVRYTGASNICGWQLQKIVDLTEQLGINPISTLQQQYSLASRYDEFETFCVCKLNGIAVLPWSPLKGGVLSGKYKRNLKPEEVSGRIGWVAQQENSRGNQACPEWTKLEGNESMWNTLDKLEEIGKAKGKSVAQVAIRWLIQRDVVGSVLIGARNMKQLDDNLGASSGWKLSAEEMTELDELSMPEIPYPYEQMWRLNKNLQRSNRFAPSYLVGNVKD